MMQAAILSDKISGIWYGKKTKLHLFLAICVGISLNLSSMLST